MTLLTLVLLTAFVSLGRWQWQRGEAKQSMWAEFEHAPPAGCRCRTHRSIDAVATFRVAFARGGFEPAQQFLLDNRIACGQARLRGADAFRARQGRARAGESRLGCRSRVIATGCRTFRCRSGSRTHQPAASTNCRAAGLASGRAPPARTRHWPKLTASRRTRNSQPALGRKLARRIVLLDPGHCRSATTCASGRRPAWHPTRHFSYAIQWWGFAVVLLVLYFGLNFRKVS